jgi:outer membrane autotransporter protein
MKKTLQLLTFFSLICFNSQAKEGFYIGIDANRSHAKHRISVVVTTPITQVTEYVDNKSDKKAVNVGANVGYNFALTEKFYISPELFYDHLNNSAADPYGNPDFRDAGRGASYDNDRNTLNYRYGAKVNFSYRPTQKLGLFVNAGIANIDYDVKWNSNLAPDFSNISYHDNKIAPIYGIGLSYDITQNITFKTSLDYQSFNITYAFEGLRSKVNLNVIKAGVAYNF